MNLAISNIAWNIKDNEAVYKELNKYGFRGVEIAPAKINNELLFLDSIKKYNLTIPAMQSLLYKQEHLELFFNTDKTINFLKNLILFASRLGCKVLVFGAPKNRDIRHLTQKEAFNKAVEIFYELGEFALNNDCIFAIEPNAKEYNCNFITNTDEAIELVKAVNSKGFRFHFDSAVAYMNNENLEKSIKEALPYMAHFHISSPFLESILNTKELHENLARIIKDSSYKHFLSIEMREQENKNLDNIKRSLEYVASLYLQ